MGRINFLRRVYATLLAELLMTTGLVAPLLLQPVATWVQRHMMSGMIHLLLFIPQVPLLIWLHTILLFPKRMHVARTLTLTMLAAMFVLASSTTALTIAHCGLASATTAATATVTMCAIMALLSLTNSDSPLMRTISEASLESITLTLTLLLACIFGATAALFTTVGARVTLLYHGFICISLMVFKFFLDSWWAKCLSSAAASHVVVYLMFAGPLFLDITSLFAFIANISAYLF